MICIHHWMIEPPTGPESIGICKRCKEVKIFPNSIDNEENWRGSKAFQRREEFRERKLRTDFALSGKPQKVRL